MSRPPWSGVVHVTTKRPSLSAVPRASSCDPIVAVLTRSSLPSLDPSALKIWARTAPKDVSPPVWTDHSQTGGDTSFGAVRAQIFNADGSRLGNELLVNTATMGSQDEARGTALSDGRFVVTWTTPDHGGRDISAQVFNAD